MTGAGVAQPGYCAGPHGVGGMGSCVQTMSRRRSAAPVSYIPLPGIQRYALASSAELLGRIARPLNDRCVDKRAVPASLKVGVVGLAELNDCVLVGASGSSYDERSVYRGGDRNDSLAKKHIESGLTVGALQNPLTLAVK